VLRLRRGELPLSEPQKEAARALETEFDRTMTEERTSQVRLLEHLHDVRHTRSKAFLLFKKKELAELETMARALADHPHQEKALPYLRLVNGLVAELKGESEEALTNYQLLLDDPAQTLTEDALLQIAGMSLACGDIENALLTVECLTGLSAAYLPPYGDLLKAVGRPEEAFHIYNRYVGLVPDDIGGVMKLAVFCMEAGLTDPARELFQKVLSAAPQNEAAQRLLDQLGPPPTGSDAGNPTA
jgi:tetratricopeptide (TPR) repeat protein